MKYADLKGVSGIYQIRNKITGKIYIGSAVDLKNRFRQHRQDLNGNCHGNSLLQRAWNKYWEQSFVFEIIELVSDKFKLIEREQYYIDLASAANRKFGYNLSPVAGSTLGVQRSAETRLKLSKWQKGKPKPAVALALTGRKLPEETKVKMVESQKKRHALNPEHGLSLGKRLIGNKIRRNKEKWPHELGIRCKCTECRQKHNEYNRKYYHKTYIKSSPKSSSLLVVTKIFIQNESGLYV